MSRLVKTSGLIIAIALTSACSDDKGAADAGHGLRDAGPSCETSPHTGVPACSQVVGTSAQCHAPAHLAPTDAGIGYDANPPASGAHWPFWEQTWGEHTAVVPREMWVHNLEHGGVVLLYNCPQGCDSELAVLRQVIASRSTQRVLLTADPLLAAPRFAAVSWTWTYRTDTPDLPTLLCFVDQHEGHAPEDVP